MSVIDDEHYSICVCPNDEFHVCGFRAFAKNIWGFLANGMGACGVNHSHDNKVNMAETPLSYLSHLVLFILFTCFSEKSPYLIYKYSGPFELSLSQSCGARQSEVRTVLASGSRPHRGVWLLPCEKRPHRDVSRFQTFTSGAV